MSKESQVIDTIARFITFGAFAGFSVGAAECVNEWTCGEHLGVYDHCRRRVE